MSTADLIIGAVTAILSPLIVFGIKLYWDSIAKKAAEQALAAQNAQDQHSNTASQTQGTAGVNQSIDAQAASRQQWEESQRPKPS